MFSDSLISFGSRMAFRLNALVTSSEDCEGNTAQWRRQARVIVQDFFSMDLPTDFAVYTQDLQKLVNHLFCMASHLTLKSVSNFLRNVIMEATEMSPGQATYFLLWVLHHAKAITDSEKLQIPSLPEKECLLQSLADNPALCLILMNHPASPAPLSSVGLAQTLGIGGSSPPHSGGFTSSVHQTVADLHPLSSSTPVHSLPELHASVPESFQARPPSNPFGSSIVKMSGIRSSGGPSLVFSSGLNLPTFSTSAANFCSQLHLSHHFPLLSLQ